MSQKKFLMNGLMDCLSNYGDEGNQKVNYAVQEICRLCTKDMGDGEDLDMVLRFILEGLETRGLAAETTTKGTERTIAFTTVKLVTGALLSLPEIWETDFPLKLWIWKLLGDETLKDLEDPGKNTNEEVWDQYLRREALKERIVIVGVLQNLDIYGNYIEWEIHDAIIAMLGKVLIEEESKLELLRTDSMNRRRLAEILASHGRSNV